jgi:predicted metalloprotease with PDZ domain
MKTFSQLLVGAFILITCQEIKAKNSALSAASEILNNPEAIVSDRQTRYSIRIDKENPKIAQVGISLFLEDDILYMAPGADQLPKRWATFVHNLKVRDENGHEVPIKELEDAQWKVDYEIGKKVTVTYEIVLDHEEHQWSGGLDGVAYTTDWGVFYTGRALLIFNGANEEKVNVAFDVPENWKVTTPWQIVPNVKNSFLALNHSDLSQSMIFAGTHEELSFKREGFELVFALGGDQVLLKKDNYASLANGVMDYYVNLMGGLPKPPPNNPFQKSIVVINNSSSTDGEVIGNNISILIEEDGGHMSQMLSTFIFAHEFFHLWNGKSFLPVGDDTEWFKEGFTNYYTLKALHHVGFLDDDSFFGTLNDLFYQRYNTDDGLGTISVTKGEEKHAHWGLIYGGGLFIGISQDIIIRKNSGNQKSLDDLLRALYTKFGGTSTTYTIRDIQEILTDLNGTDQTDFFNNYIFGVERIPIDKYLTMAGLDAKIQNGNLTIAKKESANPEEKLIIAGMYGSLKGK